MDVVRCSRENRGLSVLFAQNVERANLRRNSLSRRTMDVVRCSRENRGLSGLFAQNVERAKICGIHFPMRSGMHLYFVNEHSAKSWHARPPGWKIAVPTSPATAGMCIALR